MRSDLDAAAVLHWFDVQLLAHLLDLDETEARRRFDRLGKLPFVEKFPDRHVVMRNVHETTRLAWRKRLAMERPNVWQTLSARAGIGSPRRRHPYSASSGFTILLCAEPDEGARRLEEMDRVWTSTAHPEHRQALALALNELETSALLKGRARVEGLLCLAEVRSLRGATAHAEGVARKIEALAPDIGHAPWALVALSASSVRCWRRRADSRRRRRTAYRRVPGDQPTIGGAGPQQCGRAARLSGGAHKVGNCCRLRASWWRRKQRLRREQDPSNAGWQRELAVTLS